MGWRSATPSGRLGVPPVLRYANAGKIPHQIEIQLLRQISQTHKTIEWDGFVHIFVGKNPLFFAVENIPSFIFPSSPVSLYHSTDGSSLCIYLQEPICMGSLFAGIPAFLV
jgi:hypothetical protein